MHAVGAGETAGRSRASKPRGVARATDRQRAAARMVAEGQDRAAICELYGVSRKTLSDWIQKVRIAEEDEGRVVR